MSAETARQTSFSVPYLGAYIYYVHLMIYEIAGFAFESKQKEELIKGWV